VRAREVASLLVPVLIMPLDLMAEHDPELAQRIRDAARRVEQATAEDHVAGAALSASRLFTLLMSAWGRGLLDYDDLEGLVDLLTLLVASLRGASWSSPPACA
jgi:hypothetical protein